MLAVPHLDINSSILPDGTLRLVAGGGIRIRNFHGDEEFPVHITNSVTDGGFDIVFDDEPWHSTIEFTSGIPVELGATLSLGFEDAIDPTAMVGQTFRVFHWTGVEAVGEFDIAMNGLTWDTAQLYTAGTVRLIAVPEPSSFAMAVFGLVALAACERRRNTLQT